VALDETRERDIAYYRIFFASSSHENWLTTTPEPIIVSISLAGTTPKEDVVSTHREATGAREYRVLVRRGCGETRLTLRSAATTGRARLAAALRQADLADLLGVDADPVPLDDDSVDRLGSLTRCYAPTLGPRLVEMEAKLLPTRYKFGVLIVRPGQSTENEYYGNDEVPPEFESLLATLGTVAPLAGHAGFTGGLDTKRGTTGERFVHTRVGSLDLAFHVAPWIPPGVNEDGQHIARKRHLGNDVVLLVCAAAGARFDPTTIRSHFNHVFLVLSEDTDHLGVAYKEGVRLGCRPVLGDGGVVPTEEGARRDFLLTKLINAERAAMHAPEFRQLDSRTRTLMLTDVIGDTMGTQK
jgi:hypothetical protein